MAGGGDWMGSKVLSDSNHSRIPWYINTQILGVSPCRGWRWTGQTGHWWAVKAGKENDILINNVSKGKLGSFFTSGSTPPSDTTGRRQKKELKRNHCHIFSLSCCQGTIPVPTHAVGEPWADLRRDGEGDFSHPIVTDAIPPQDFLCSQGTSGRWKPSPAVLSLCWDVWLSQLTRKAEQICYDE